MLLCYEISIWRHNNQHRFAAKVVPSVVPCTATLLLDGAVDAHPGLGLSGLACPYATLQRHRISKEIQFDHFEFSNKLCETIVLGIPWQVHQGIFEENQVHGLQHVLCSVYIFILYLYTYKDLVTQLYSCRCDKFLGSHTLCLYVVRFKRKALDVIFLVQ